MDVSVLEQLDAMRYDLDGDGAADDDAAAYAAAFPGAAAGMGCPATGCVGYELTRSLDFAAASSYAAGAVESRWVQGRTGGSPSANRHAPSPPFSKVTATPSPTSSWSARTATRWAFSGATSAHSAGLGWSTST